MMSPIELKGHLKELGLNQVEAAQLLSVSPRTVRRWADGGQRVSGPAELTLRAWLRLHCNGIAWRPDSLVIQQNDEATIARHREHAIELDKLMEKVRKRGGPAAPWRVDLDRCRATLGPLQVSFYKLSNGGFSPQSYRRTDNVPADLQRDWHLIEDAYVSIAQAFSDHGNPPRIRFGFVGPSLDKGRLLFWDVTLTPSVVAVLPCATLRQLLPERELSDADCRLLGISNKNLLTEIAENLFANDKYRTSKDFGTRVIEIELQHLKKVLTRFSSTILIHRTSFY